MAKYVISPNVISVHLSGKVFEKKHKMVFDSEGKNKFSASELEAAFKAGFLVKKDSDELKAEKKVPVKPDVKKISK